MLRDVICAEALLTLAGEGPNRTTLHGSPFGPLPATAASLKDFYANERTSEETIS